MFAETGVRPHAEAEEERAKLGVCEGSEVVVVVEGEVFDEQGGHKPRAQGIYTEGHGPGERVANLLLHDQDHAIDVCYAVKVLFFACPREYVVEYGSRSERAGVDEVRDHLTPEAPLALCKTHDYV